MNPTNVPHLLTPTFGPTASKLPDCFLWQPTSCSSRLTEDTSATCRPLTYNTCPPHGSSGPFLTTDLFPRRNPQTQHHTYACTEASYAELRRCLIDIASLFSKATPFSALVEPQAASTSRYREETLSTSSWGTFWCFKYHLIQTYHSLFTHSPVMDISSLGIYKLCSFSKM